MKCREIFDKINEENKAHQEKLSQKIKESNNNLKDILKKIKVQMEKISTFSDLDDYDDGRSFTETTYSDINASHKYDFQTIHENELNILSNEKKNYTMGNEKIFEEDYSSNEKIDEEVTKEENSNFEKDEETIYHENKNIKKIILNVLNADIKQYLNSKLKSRNIKQEQDNKNENKKLMNDEIKKEENENILTEIKNNKNEIKNNNKNNQFDKKDIKIINIEKKRNENKKIIKKNKNIENKNFDIEVNENNNDPILKNKPIEFIKKNNCENIKKCDIENSDNNMESTLNNLPIDKIKKDNFEINNFDIQVDSNKINKAILYEIKNFDIQVNKIHEPLIKNDIIDNNFESKNFNIEPNENHNNENNIKTELNKFSIKNNLDNGVDIKKLKNNNLSMKKFDISLNLNAKEKDNKKKSNYQLEIAHNIPITLKSKQIIITNEVNYFIQSQNDENLTNCSSINNKYDNQKNELKISLNEDFNLSPENVEKKVLKEECINFQPFINKNKVINYTIDSFSISSPIKKKAENIINFNDGFFIKGHGRRIENAINLFYFPQKNSQNKNMFIIQKNEIIIENKEDKKKDNVKNNFSVISNNLNLMGENNIKNNNNLIILSNEKETKNNQTKNNYSINSNSINFISNNKDINNKKETKNNQTKNNYSINSNSINFISNNKDINNIKDTNNNDLENNFLINTNNNSINNENDMDNNILLEKSNNNKENKKVKKVPIKNKNKKNIPEDKLNVYSFNLLKELNTPIKQINTVDKLKQKKSFNKENSKDNNYIEDKSYPIRNNSYKGRNILSNRNKVSNPNFQEKCNNNFQKKIKDIFQREDEIHLEVKDFLKRSRQNTESSTRRNLLIPYSNSQINTNSRTFFNTQVNCMSLSTNQNESLNENINENEETENNNLNEDNIITENIDEIYDNENDYNYNNKYNNENIDNYNDINNYNNNYNEIYNNIHTYKFDNENPKNNNIYERKINYDPPQKIKEIKKKSHSVNPNKMRNTREEYFNLKNQIELLKKERDFILNHKNEPQKKLFSDKKIRKKLKKENKINLSKSLDNTLEAQIKADKYFEYKLLQDELFKRLELDKRKDDDDNLSQNSLLKSHDSFGEYVDKIIKRSFKLYTNRQCTFCAKLLSQGKSTSLCPKKHHTFKKKI